MVKFGTRVRAYEFLPHANFCKNRLRGYTSLGKFIPKNYQFGRFWRLLAHIFKATTVKFGVRLRYWDTLSMPNFVFKKSLKGPAGIALPCRGDAYWFLVRPTFAWRQVGNLVWLWKMLLWVLIRRDDAQKYVFTTVVTVIWQRGGVTEQRRTWVCIGARSTPSRCVK